MMQLDILLFLQSIRTEAVGKVAEVISLFGEIAIPLLIVMILIWCVSRKKAFAAVTALLSALIVSQTLKAIFRVQRPFQKYPHLIQGERLSTATGYSFPSGHSTTSGAFYSSLIVTAWNRWATLLCLLPIILVPLSRMILGVHWPMDVAAGTVIGLLSGFIITPLMLRLYDAKRPFLIFTFTFGLVTAVSGAFIAVLLAVTEIDRVAFEDMMSTLSITGGAMLGFYLERKFVSSAPESGSLGIKIVRFILGLISTALVAIIISIVPAPEEFTSFTTYFALGIWCIYLYPLLAVRLHLMDAE